MKYLVAPALAAGILAAPALAQEPAMKPGPEQARIGFFAGTWQYEGEAQASPMGPGGKITGTDNCQWFAGGFQLICQGDGTGPRGAMKNGSIWGFDPAQGKYTYYGYNSMGEGFFVLGTVQGKVWTWTADMPAGGGATVKIRAILTEQTPTQYSLKVESSADGTTWNTMEEGRATKRGSR